MPSLLLYTAAQTTALLTVLAFLPSFLTHLRSVILILSSPLLSSSSVCHPHHRSHRRISLSPSSNLPFFHSLPATIGTTVLTHHAPSST